MAIAFDHEEQEQLAELKAWWARWGNLLLGLALAALVASACWYGWRFYQARQAAEASVRYDELQRAVAERDVRRAGEAAGELLEHFRRTEYATLGALLAARAYHDAGDIKNARAKLEWVIEAGSTAESRGIARLRLANILIDQKDFEAAASTLGSGMPEALAALAAERLGDMRLLQNRPDEARSAWRDALSKAKSPGSGLTERLQGKLDSLGAS
jgi:predicted negative regulator of RcsB-dependent stress response